MVAQGDAEQEDFDAIYDQKNQQALAEYEHFKKMLDRIIGPDEQIKKPKTPRRDASGKRKAPVEENPKGGEIVTLDNIAVGGG